MKTTVGDYERFQQDKSFWDGKYYTNALYLVDGEKTDDLEEGLHPGIEIQIMGGTVWNDNSSAPNTSLVEFFRKWHQQKHSNKNESLFSIPIVPVHVRIPIKLDAITLYTNIYLDNNGNVKARMDLCGDFSKSEIKSMINEFQTVLSALEQMEKK